MSSAAPCPDYFSTGCSRRHDLADDSAGVVKLASGLIATMAALGARLGFFFNEDFVRCGERQGDAGIRQVDRARSCVGPLWFANTGTSQLAQGRRDYGIGADLINRSIRITDEVGRPRGSQAERRLAIAIRVRAPRIGCGTGPRARVGREPACRVSPSWGNICRDYHLTGKCPSTGPDHPVAADSVSAAESACDVGGWTQMLLLQGRRSSRFSILMAHC